MSVTLTREGRIALLTLDDGKANALRPDTLHALDAALDEALDCGALVLAGRPGFFSGGLDTRHLPTLSPDEQHAAFLLFARVLVKIWDYPRPTIGAVTGHAIAGGALLALAQDVRVGADGAWRFGLTEVPLGLPMPTFGVEIVRCSTPRCLQNELLLHGRVFTHAEAREATIFEDLYSPERVIENALRRAAPLSKLASDAYSITKQRLRGGAGARAMAALVDEVPPFLTLFRERMPGAR